MIKGVFVTRLRNWKVVNKVEGKKCVPTFWNLLSKIDHFSTENPWLLFGKYANKDLSLAFVKMETLNVG